MTPESPKAPAEDAIAITDPAEAPTTAASSGAPAATNSPEGQTGETELNAPPLSAPLRAGWFNPMPGGFVGGYAGDTGVDIAGFHMPVYAVAAGTIIYSEPGHTRWASDDRAVLLRLDTPITVERRLADDERSTRSITHVWYAHLSVLRFQQATSSRTKRRVGAGELLGISGIANGSPHLHLGLLLDNVTDQRWDSYLLDDECREVLGGWRSGQRLPAVRP